MGARLQNQLQDGCGPYGRHLTGAVCWQKYYMIAPNAGDVQMLPGEDWLLPVPPPSERLSSDAFAFFVSLAGDATSRIRLALYDMTTFPAGRLIDQTGEVNASVAGQNTIAFPLGSYSLCQSTRYAVLACATGVLYPRVFSAANPLPFSWMGCRADGRTPGMARFTRAYGAFPAVYNGVFSAFYSDIMMSVSLRLP
jgi:hypothetical protein